VVDLWLRVGAGRVLMGCRPGCGIVLPDPTVSRLHATRVKEGDSVTFGPFAPASGLGG
jgi:pSer/pThr/pTyr-binding forkhead associated (FHA) protein